MQQPSKFQLPTRRVVASLALVSVLSAIEKQRKARKTLGEEEFTAQDMSGELQTIPARHGVAAFVPRGRTIKIINTYGKQVVSTWAFGLHAPPREGDDEEELEEEVVQDVEKKVGNLKEKLKSGQAKEQTEKEMQEETQKPRKEDKKAEVNAEPAAGNKESKTNKGNSKVTTEEEKSKHSENPPEQVPKTPENGNSAADKKTGKRTWSSYLPSIPYRSKTQSKKTVTTSTLDGQTEKEQQEATSKAWSSYLPTGKGFSSYVSNVQLPDSQDVISAFKASHHRDPNKSFAEQLYDFSKTPVGAAGIAAATGSGAASSIYAAYSAYTKMNPSSNDLPPMEYLSLPHTRASTHRLVPIVQDTLLTNLRNPIMTLIEDTTPGAHDTLTAACDANLYAALNVDKPAEHGSCAENLVLALKELNEKAGLKGIRAIGADITVNIAPTPLHLFMNAPLKLDPSAQTTGSGAKGATLQVEEPQGKKRSYVRFRAERDMVIVLSACPMDIGRQNGGKCMAANFMVEKEDEDSGASTPPLNKTTSSKKATANAEQSGKKKEAAKTSTVSPKGSQQKPGAVKNPLERPRNDSDDPPKSQVPANEKAAKEGVEPKDEERKEPKTSMEQPTSQKQEEPRPKEKKEESTEEPPKPRRKPKKLERRSAGGTFAIPTTPKTEPS